MSSPLSHPLFRSRECQWFLGARGRGRQLPSAPSPSDLQAGLSHPWGHGHSFPAQREQVHLGTQTLVPGRRHRSQPQRLHPTPPFLVLLGPIILVPPRHPTSCYWGDRTLPRKHFITSGAERESRRAILLGGSRADAEGPRSPPVRVCLRKVKSQTAARGPGGRPGPGRLRPCWARSKRATDAPAQRGSRFRS